jgi:hypothetical protein
MSLKNNKITSLKYYNWIKIYYPKMDIDALERLPFDLEVFVPPKTYTAYWFPWDAVVFLLACLPYNIKNWQKKISNKQLDQVNPKIAQELLSSFTEILLKTWTTMLPVVNDLYFLYVKHNKILTETDFVLLDFWFDSLQVIDELMFIFGELNLSIYFRKDPLRLSKMFELSISDIFLIEPTEENLKNLNCKFWSKQNFVNYIYKQFSKIDVNVLHQWLVYKKIENKYENKEIFVREYIINSVKGLNSLSLSTLKLLAINPILDLDHVRVLHQERKLYHLKQSEAKGPQTEAQAINSFLTTIKFAVDNSKS